MLGEFLDTSEIVPDGLIVDVKGTFWQKLRKLACSTFGAMLPESASYPGFALRAQLLAQPFPLSVHPNHCSRRPWPAHVASIVRCGFPLVENVRYLPNDLADYYQLQLRIASTVSHVGRPSVFIDN